MSGVHQLPLGASLSRTGALFSIWAPEASRVELCLLDAQGGERRFDLERQGLGCWYLELEGIFSGQRYGYRVHGSHDPARGRIFRPDLLLSDPRALAFEAREACLSRLVDPRFDWSGDRPPETPWRDSVIYELHVRGMTRLHPELPPRIRGTYLGLAHPAVIEHLLNLGVTAVELMPVFQFVSEAHLQRQGLTNYWGYNPIGLFAPHDAYACEPGQQVREFQEMVMALHRAGIEVLLDVVFNHTAEGGADGPVLSWKALCNRFIYRLDPLDPSRYEDWTGCGNTLHAGMRAVLDLVRDSLRYWVEVMHVDGFRFDLASTLGRSDRSFHPDAPFFQILRQDEVLSRVKYIAEPWDLGPGGYRLGQFPEGWREWNDRFRDTVRSFWRGDPGRIPELATRIAGSSDVFAHRGPTSSINFVTAHDGFTLMDLVSYEGKHNLANRESNRDGSSRNFSRNWGVEGPTSDPAIRELRDRIRRSLLATLVLSQGVPMIAHGDELGRTQRGNNNPYCHDNELTWISWSKNPRDEAFLAFFQRLLELRRRFANFRAEIHFNRNGDVTWLDENGLGLSESDWNCDDLSTFGLHFHGADEELLVVLHNGKSSLLYTLPKQARATENRRWFRRLDTARPESRPRFVGTKIRLLESSVSLLERRSSPESQSPRNDSRTSITLG